VKYRGQVEICYPDKCKYLMKTYSNGVFKGLDDMGGFVLSGLISFPHLQIRGN
jgi:hypothetical protein